MENPSIQFNVLSQWMASSGILSVQAVEFETAETQKLLGPYAVRVCFLDARTGAQVMCITMNGGATKEFCELMEKATASITAAEDR